jgi:uncharacterized membrane protein
MRKALQSTVAVFIFSGLLLQWVARWSPVVLSRLGPPTGAVTSTSEDPLTTAIADED